MKGFFAKSDLRKEPRNKYLKPQCSLCRLYKKCDTPKMEVSGKGRRKVLLLAQSPGPEEDKKGRQFVGSSGKLLESLLASINVDMRKDCWLTNALICYPGSDDGLIEPTTEQLEWCRPNFLETMRALKPNVVIAMGQYAVEIAVMQEWTSSINGIGRWAGYQIPSRKLNAWICPLHHPAYLDRELHDRKTGGVIEKGRALKTLMLSHLKRAFEKAKAPPYEAPPNNMEQEVQIILNSEEAAKKILWIARQEGEAAFDYETNMLKPDSAAAAIVSCSICWEGKRTIAYPWTRETAEATRQFIISPIKKIASNIKFEERWTRAKLGTPVRNWHWDTMLAAHWLENKPDVTSLKFQAYVLLGIGTYDEHIRSYLQGEGGNKPNRIHEIHIRDLLLYNGLDSLLEYHVAQIQKGG